MDILGIRNRTENWKTVKHFYRLSKGAKERLARHLLANQGITSSQVQLGSDDVHIELFWKGVRDYVHKKDDKDTWIKKFSDIYNSLFPDLRKFVQNPKYKFQKLTDINYDVSKPEYRRTLYNNLRGTEIDIVLETSDHLFIGEAKDESRLGRNGKYVLVHQLIRQYVMAKILLEIVYSSNDKKGVIPFIVGTNLSSIKNHDQVKLMIDKGWLKEKNVLTWKCIEELINRP